MVFETIAFERGIWPVPKSTIETLKTSGQDGKCV